ncbi:succinate dehydrogenase, hydrophobic membrane anchor protein [Oceaniovalibus sp. ACAM 378]|uniref:succinate dehydrogenase, hydrophobic membrane anchor protein n=1 Tax=Oceaniovalibus sp. ACAM 378 TaxID=2599923 RepID=UPI0011D98482|nr:succinate dehydrogenase, hydrophobic membrane anchor protein [Oceaniovalibus sp. ACAM 378]TYB90031.1 succinate dehydrogenase, hydrophobic membrane anchor protein [Oceaniovalibus sp. ACAM 378]
MTRPRITPYSAAHGLGAAGHAARHWWAQRVSAIALVPLVLWLVWALANGGATDYAALSDWLKSPINTILMILLLIAAFHHAALGLQTIAEDYIHSRARFAVIALVQLACAAGGAAGIVATLLIAITS